MVLSIDHWITTSLCVAIASLLVYAYRRHNRYWSSRGIPTAPYVPIIGSFWDLVTRKLAVLEFFEKCYNMTDKKVLGLFIFHKPGLLIRCPDMIRQLYVKDFTSFPNRYLAHNPDDAIGTNNLFFLKSPEWDELKKLESPSFTSSKVKTTFIHINEVGEDLNKYLSEVISENQNEGIVCDARDLTLRYALDLISSFVFGIRSNCLRDNNDPLTETGRDILIPTIPRIIQLSSIFFLPQLVPVLGIKFLTSKVANFIRQLTWDAINQREASGVKRNDFIDIVIKLKNMPYSGKGLKFEKDTIASQMVVFFIGGYETTAVSLSFALYELALNTDIQEKLRVEILQMTEDNGGEITYDLIMDMTYLDMVVSETLRKHPPLAILDRECTVKKGYTLPEPYNHVTISYNTPIYISSSAIQMDPKYYPDPEVFDPERFTKEAKQSRHPYTYMPFGVGPRACIGERLGLLQVKVGLLYILKDYRISTCSKTPIPLVVDPLGFTKSAKGGLHLKFDKINSG